MTSRNLLGTSAGSLPIPVHDLSGTSAIPRSWWTPPASYVIIKYCHCQNKLNLELIFQKKVSLKKNQLRGQPFWATICYRSQHTPPENNALTRTPFQQAHVHQWSQRSPGTRTCTWFWPCTQLLLAKKPNRVK